MIIISQYFFGRNVIHADCEIALIVVISCVVLSSLKVTVLGASFTYCMTTIPHLLLDILM